MVVDNAHLLSDQSLIQLTSLRDSLRLGDCRVLLSGEPCLQHRLKKLSGQSRAAAGGHVINIPSLDRREVASYIDMKLYHAGMEGRGPFSRLVIERIARNSNGHPGRIDAMASAFLNGGRQGTQWRRASGQLQRFIRRLSAFRDFRHP
jgi:type II secretory pathway predicted ATPase ExeA